MCQAAQPCVSTSLGDSFPRVVGLWILDVVEIGPSSATRELAGGGGEGQQSIQASPLPSSAPFLAPSMCCCCFSPNFNSSTRGVKMTSLLLLLLSVISGSGQQRLFFCQAPVCSHYCIVIQLYPGQRGRACLHLLFVFPSTPALVANLKIPSRCISRSQHMSRGFPGLATPSSIDTVPKIYRGAGAPLALQIKVTTPNSTALPCLRLMQ